MILDLTPAEKRAVELLREIKTRTGHGRLVVEVVAGAESLFDPTFREKPPK